MIPKRIIETRIDLEEQLGIYDLAWRYEDAVKLIKFCRNHNLFIMGGDVLKIHKNNEIEFTYDNWSSDIITDKDSTKATDSYREYINKYPNKEDFIYSFVIEGMEERIDLIQQLGMLDLAWRYEDAIKVIELCKNHKIFITGGMALKTTTKTGGLNFSHNMNFTDCKWLTKPENKNNCIKAAEQSIDYINNYITRYPHQDDYYIIIEVEG